MERITMAHGSGGKIMHDLLEKNVISRLGIEGVLTDSAVIKVDNVENIAYTTDSFVVFPLFFPGGDIGDLAVNGTVNDLSMMGAMPRFLACSFIIEEGLEIDVLNTITESISAAAASAGVEIVTGDTKVVNKGKGDGIFINTSGIGVIDKGVHLHPTQVKAGDKIIINAPIGRHGVAVMGERNGLMFEPPVLSDCAPLNGLVADMLSATKEIRVMRDPTRGGLASALKEIAMDARLSFFVDEDKIPLDDGVRGACELLGFDPLYVANEGVLIAFAPGNVSEFLVSRMREHPLGATAAIIGEVNDENPGMVFLRTVIGGTRVLDMLSGEQLPRIC